MRACSFCAGKLVWVDGKEESAADRGGNAKETDFYRCNGCSRLYKHIARERFDGVDHWWGLKDGEGFVTLEEDRWPKWPKSPK